MTEQNYKNHTRYVPSFHFVTLPMVFIFLVASIINLVTSSDKITAGLIFVGSLVSASLYYHTRVFPLKAQSRAIRAEENLRHFALTGRLLDKRLRLSQIVALRFASDDQFVELAQKAADEKLTNDQIKRLVKSWRADWSRV